MATIGSLRVNLTADSASFVADMGKVQSTLRRQNAEFTRFSSNINRQASALTTSLKAVAGAFAIGQIGAISSRALEYASSLGEVSQQLGVTTQDLQVYRFAASQVGISQEDMDKSLAKLTQSLGKASLGADAPAKAFAALGINVRDSSGHVKTAGQVIPELADKLSKVTDPAQRAAVEVALFGKAGQKLDTLLAGGRGQVDALAASAQRLGVVLSPDMINRADEAADKLSAVKQVLEAKIASVVADNAGAIVGLANAMGSIVDWAGKAATAYDNFKKSVTARVLVSSGTGWFASDEDFKRMQRGLRDMGLSSGASMGSVPGSVSVPWAKGPGVAPTSAANVELPEFLAGNSGGGKSAADKAAEEAAKFRAEAERLVQDLVPAIGRFEEYKAANDTLEQALAKGIITQDQFTLSLAGLKDKFGALPSEIDALPPSIAGVTDALDKMAEKGVQAAQALKFEVPDLRDKFSGIRELAPDIADATGYAMESVLRDYRNIGQAGRALLQDITAIFQRKFLVEPVTKWIENAIGGLGKGGASSLTSSSDTTAQAVSRLGQAADIAAAKLTGGNSTAGIPSGVSDALSLPKDIDPADLRLGAVSDNLDALALSTAKNSQALQQQLPVIGQFGSGLQQVLSSLSSGGGGGGLLGGILKIGGSLLKGAIGGTGISSPVGISSGLQSAISTPLVSMDSLAVVQPLNFASGGYISGPGGPKADLVPAMLSNGEFVMNADAVSKIGIPALSALNAGHIPGFAKGGPVYREPSFQFPPGLRNFDRARERPSPTFHINVTAPNSGDSSRDRQSAMQHARVIQHEISKAGRRGMA